MNTGNAHTDLAAAITGMSTDGRALKLAAQTMSGDVLRIANKLETVLNTVYKNRYSIMFPVLVTVLKNAQQYSDDPLEAMERWLNDEIEEELANYRSN